jgi:hypothetical protein
VHVITKILVVFAAVLSVLLSALTIAYSTNAQRVVGGYTAAKLEAETAKAQLAAEKANQIAELASRDTQITDLTTQLEDARADREQLKLDNGKLLAQSKVAEAAQMTVQARIDQLAAMSQMQASLIESMYQEVGRLRESELRYAQREIEFTDRFNDLTAQLEVARETNRALQEQLVSVQGASKSAGPASGTAQARPAGSEIRARVTNVRTDTSGALLAEINVGSSDRVSKDMKFMVTRGDQFIANLVVDRVDLNEAVGRIDTLNRPVTVLPGDTVKSIPR